MLEIVKGIEILIGLIQKDYEGQDTGPRDHVREKMIKEFNESIQIIDGNKYIKIVARGGVWGFIVKKPVKGFVTGDILKAASYNAPAMNFRRGNVIRAEGFARIRWTGAQ